MQTEAEDAHLRKAFAKLSEENSTLHEQVARLNLEREEASANAFILN